MALRTAPARRRPARTRLLDADAQSITAALALVAGGAAVSVTLVGLRFGERLLPDAIEAGRDARLVVSADRDAAGSVSISIRRLPS
ncbi:MAG TPA: hypothetical protein VKA85_11985 [Candidatus Limnocylindrales bacterium]|nr:hypothetical protein [Candidatus Limnocylindrales bacterium]